MGKGVIMRAGGVGVDTSDATAGDNDVVEGKIYYGKNGKGIGTYYGIKNIKKKQELNINKQLIVDQEVELFRESFQSLGVIPGSNILIFLEMVCSTSKTTCYPSFFLVSNSSIDVDIATSFNPEVIDCVSFSLVKNDGYFVCSAYKVGVYDNPITIKTLTVRILSMSSLEFASRVF